MFGKKEVLKKSQNSEEYTCVGVSLMKLQACRAAALLWKGSNTGVFL